MVKNNFAKYIRSSQNLEQQVKKVIIKSRFYLLICAMALIAIIYVVIHQPTYIVPYGLEKGIKVSINRVDPYYLMTLARNDAQTYFDVTPQTIAGASDIFLRRVSPEYFGRTEVDLKKRETEYIDQNKSTIFYPENNITINADTITIKGNLITLVGTSITDNKIITLNVHYEIDNGHAYIKSWAYE